METLLDTGVSSQTWEVLPTKPPNLRRIFYKGLRKWWPQLWLSLGQSRRSCHLKCAEEALQGPPGTMFLHILIRFEVL